MKTLEFNQMESVQGGSKLACAAGFIAIVGIWGGAVLNPAGALAFAVASGGEAIYLAASITVEAFYLMDKNC